MSYVHPDRSNFVAQSSSQAGYRSDRSGDDGDRRRSRRDEGNYGRTINSRRRSPSYGEFGSDYKSSVHKAARFEGEPGSTRWIESRAEYRKNLKFSIWPPSPPAPAKSRLSPLQSTHKRSHSYSRDDTDVHRKHRSRHRHRDDEDDEERRRRKHRKSHREHSDSDSPRSSSGRDINTVKPQSEMEDDFEDAIGPMPLPEDMLKLRDKDFGTDMLKGEGSAMAQFVQDGQRIPRRGEIGLESVEIDKFEQAGYVMSGNRHKRMNEVRVRKENQVYTAEEKRKMLKEAAEDRLKKENEIVASFKELVSEKLKPKSSNAKERK